MTLDQFKAALEVAAAQTNKAVFTEALTVIEDLRGFDWHCLVNGLRDMQPPQ